MNSRCVVALMATTFCLVSQAYAQTQEDRAMARDLVAKRGDAVVFVLGTTKLRVNQGGKDLPTADQRIQSLVTILDSSGLGVMSLTALDPSELMSAQLSRGRAAAAAINVTTEQSNLRYRMPDGREIPVRVVLRDKELDLAFLRPVEKLAAPVTAVDAVVARPIPIDSVVVLQRLPELSGWQATALFSSVQVVVEKPRTFYVLTSGVIGSPVFDLRGRFIGVVLRFKNEADAANAPPIVLPAADIREVAKQAK